MASNRKSNKHIQNFEIASSEIIKKAQMALEVISQQQIYGNVYKKPILSNPTNVLFSKLQEDFNKFSSIIQIKAKELTNIRLLPYQQQHFYINMMENMFPITFQVTDVKNEAIIHIAYDKKFPNQNYQKYYTNKKIKTQGDQQHYVEQTNRLSNCVHRRINIDEPVKFTLQNLSGKYVSKVYITFQAKSKYSVFNIYVQGNQYSYSKSPKKKRKSVSQIRRVATQASTHKLIPLDKIQYGISSRAIIERAYIQQQQSANLKKDIQNELIGFPGKKSITNVSSSKYLSPSKSQKISKKTNVISQIVKTESHFISENSSKFHSPSMSKKQILNQSQILKSDQTVKNTEISLNKGIILPQIFPQKKNNDPSLVFSPQQPKLNLKGRSLQKRHPDIQVQANQYKEISKIQIVKINKEKHQILKQKQRVLKQLTSSIKSRIGQIQQEQKNKQTKLKKINTIISPIVYFLKFLQNTTRIYEKKQFEIVRNWRVGYLTAKFCRKMKRRYLATSNMIMYSRKRGLMSVFDMTKLSSKIMYQYSMVKATKVLFNIFGTLSKALVINHAFRASDKYVQTIKKIQVFWKAKYSARIKILNAGAQRHVKQMIIKHPHFLGSLQKFKKQDICNKMCLQYMIDQSLKFKKIYSLYLQTQEERQQLIRMNNSIIEKNKSQLLSKSKSPNKNTSPKKKTLNVQLFNIPDKTRRPNHKFFTNFNILRAMLRGWFQTQSKKRVKSQGKSLKKVKK